MVEVAESMIQQNRPNIIFIMADDHAVNAISAYGSKINSTPNIDRLAQEGALLTHCYVSNSICTPSRAAILTGTYNHVNGVMTLGDPIDNRLPNVAKHLQASGYQTGLFGKWHLGEGTKHQPTGFDAWNVLPGQGKYYDPTFISESGETQFSGYVTNLITDMSINWLRNLDRSSPFFLMMHHKAPHRPWNSHPSKQNLYTDEIQIPSTFNDDYRNRAKAASEARIRVADDLTYEDLGLAQPTTGENLGEALWDGSGNRKLPKVDTFEEFQLIDVDSKEIYKFQNHSEYDKFKYQRYLQRYLRTVSSIDDSVGAVLDFLQESELADDTLVIYTSDQGFFLGEHGWFDKRFMYEESFQMPFLIRYPKEIPAGLIINNMVSNVDFAPTFLDVAELAVPNYMQGRSFRKLWLDKVPHDWPQTVYHRYWMHRDQYHNAYAHYGIRDFTFKLIYWYNEGLGTVGSQIGGEEPEWELFDCENDPLELFNIANDPKYFKDFERMKEKLNRKMEELGDIPRH